MFRLFPHIPRAKDSATGYSDPEVALTGTDTVEPSKAGRLSSQKDLRSPEFDVFVDAFERGDDVIVEAELPGFRKRDLEIELTGNELTISGEKRRDARIRDEDYLRRERVLGAFKRSVLVPDVDAQNASAHLGNGILEIRLPRSEEREEKVRRIPIEEA